jgi:AcrR family transcriptional regulator
MAARRRGGETRPDGRGRQRGRPPIETVVRNQGLIARRHEEIFRAASRVFIARGYHQATVREIAAEAGLSLGGLYSYVRTKEDILYLVFDRLTTVLRESIRRAADGIEDPVERVRAALRADLETTERYQDEILLMYQETKSLGRRSVHAVLAREAEYVALWQDVLEAGRSRGSLKGDPRLAADLISFLCSIVALRRWSLSRRFSSHAFRDGLVAFVLRGLGLSEEETHARAALARR